MAVQIEPVPGYPAYIGNKYLQPFKYSGPFNYAPGGDPIHASDIGWGGFDWISAGTLDSSATYYIQPVFTGSDANPTVFIKWIVAATGVEYAGGGALAGLNARLLALGV